MEVQEQDEALSPRRAAAYAVTGSGPSAALFRLSGRLDFAATRQLGPGLFELVRSGRTLDLDLSAVLAIEPAGLALLIGCRRLAHASGGELRLVATSPAADQALRRAGLDRVLLLGRPPRTRPALAHS